MKYFKRYYITLFIIISSLMFSCKEITGPAEDEFPIYVNTLKPGFDIGVESSEKQRNWLYDMNGYMKMAYPSAQKWGAVFIVAGAVALENVSEDFSGYKQLAIELKGESGGESIWINISDASGTKSNPRYLFNLSGEWQTYLFPLSDFGREVNLKNLHTVINFTFSGTAASTVYFRNVRYLKTQGHVSDNVPLYLFANNLIAPGYGLGTACDSSTTDTMIAKIDIENNFLKVEYPPGKSWGSVFFYSINSVPRDFSSYDSLFLELRGEKAGKSVNIGIRDTSNFASDVKITMRDTSWHQYSFCLDSFQFLDLSHIVCAATFTFYGKEAQTIYIRNIFLEHSIKKK